MRTLLLFVALATFARGQTVEELMVKADGLDAKNKNSEALVVYLEADKLKPNDTVILQRLAKQYTQLIIDSPSDSQKRELGQKALEAAEGSVKYGPKNPDAWLARAIVYGRVAFYQSNRRKVEMSKQIKEDAETAARLNPKSDYAWHVLGRWHYELANLNPILKTLAQIIYGKFPEASNEKAAEYFRKAIAINGDRVVHHVKLGRTYLALGDKTKGRQEIEKGLALPSVTKDDEETKQRGRLALKTSS